MYFHENQLSYPQSRRQNHGWRYGFINFVSALCADANYFNSQFHLDDFLTKLPRMLKHFADYNELQTIDEIRQIKRTCRSALTCAALTNTGTNPPSTSRPSSFGITAGNMTRTRRHS